MSKYKKITPEGFFDVLFPESYRQRLIEGKILNVFRSFGYFEVKPPLVEFYEVFENQFLDNTNSFKLFDSKGRITVLRPDITIPIARLVASKLKKKSLPIKLSYNDSVFRLNERYGKSREVFQGGIELIGASNQKADAEIITVAIEALKSSGLTKFQIDIGQSEFFNRVIKNLELENEDIETLRDLIDKKDLVGVEVFLNSNNVSSNTKEILLNLYSYYGDAKVIKKIRDKSDNENYLEPLIYLEDVYNILVKRGYKEYISIDLAMVSPTNYYTGIIIKGFSYGTGYPIISGGRYDELLSKFGFNTSAVGFCININELLASISRQKIEIEVPKTKVFLSSEKGLESEVFEVAQGLRKNNIIVEEDILELNIKNLAKYLLERKIPKALYIKDKTNVLVFETIDGEIIKKEILFSKLNSWMEENKWNI